MSLNIQNVYERIVLHRNMEARSGPFLLAIEQLREYVLVGVECIFTWYWLADLCAEENVFFVLGQALYAKTIHRGQAKNDRIDSRKSAALMLGGTFAKAYVNPARMRVTSDLPGRRNHLAGKQAELFSHIEHTNGQHDMEFFGRPRGRIGSQ